MFICNLKFSFFFSLCIFFDVFIRRCRRHCRHGRRRGRRRDHRFRCRMIQYFRVIRSTSNSIGLFLVSVKTHCESPLLCE